MIFSYLLNFLYYLILLKSKMNNNNLLLYLNNGYIDLTNGKFNEYTNDIIKNNININADYDKTLNWENEDVKYVINYLQSLFSNRYQVDKLLMILSNFYNNINKIFIFYGLGCNGKSTLCNILYKLYNTYSININIDDYDIKKDNYKTIKDKELFIIDDNKQKKVLDGMKLNYLLDNFDKDIYNIKINELKQIQLIKYTNKIVNNHILKSIKTHNLIYVCNQFPYIENINVEIMKNIELLNFDIKFVKDPKNNYEKEIKTDIYDNLIQPKRLNALLWLLIETYKKYHI